MYTAIIVEEQDTMLEIVIDPKTPELKLDRGSKAGEEEVEEEEVKAMAEEDLAEAMAVEAGEEEATAFPTATATTERRGPVTTVE